MFSRYKLGMPALYQAPASWEKLKKKPDICMLQYDTNKNSSVFQFRCSQALFCAFPTRFLKLTFEIRFSQNLKTSSNSCLCIMLAYFLLVLTKQVDGTFRALWLVHQTRYILGYSPPDEIFKMAARFATVTEEEIRQMNEEATPANTKSTCLVNTKTTIPLSVGA